MQLLSLAFLYKQVKLLGRGEGEEWSEPPASSTLIFRPFCLCSYFCYKMLQKIPIFPFLSSSTSCRLPVPITLGFLPLGCPPTYVEGTIKGWKERK